MILDLKKVFLNENESLSVHEDIDFSDMQENFREPVHADITVRNRAGVAEFLAETEFKYFCVCDRCLKSVVKNFRFRFSHILIAVTIYKHLTISSILCLYSEMIFFWNFRQSSSAKNRVRACVLSAEKILMKAVAHVSCMSLIQGWQCLNSSCRNDFRYFYYIQGGEQKWQYLREKLLKQEKTQDVRQYGSLQLPLLQNALIAVSTSSLTEPAQTAVLTEAE